MALETLAGISASTSDGLRRPAGDLEGDKATEATAVMRCATTRRRYSRTTYDNPSEALPAMYTHAASALWFGAW